MGIKDFYEFTNSINRTSRILEKIGAMSSAIELAQKTMAPFFSEKAYTPTIIKLAQEQQRIASILAPQLEIFAKQQKIFNTITPQMALISEALKPYLELRERFKVYDFNAISNKWAQITEVIAKQRVNSMLLADYWIIMDDKLFNELKDKCLNDRFDTNKYIVRYYSNHKFENIKNVLAQIKNSNCLESRQVEIFEDCYTAMKKLSNKIACNTLIPTLTAQADGLLTAICNIIPNEVKKVIMEEKGIKKNSSTATIILAYLETLTVHGTTEKFKVVIKGKAFNKPKKNDKYKKSRHKILHGKCDYGSKENLVRCWLEIAFLIKVYCLILAKQQEKEIA